MTRSPYITVPDPKNDLLSVIAAVNALKHNVNLLIVNSQSPTQQNLSGAQVYALKSDLDALAGLVNRLM